MMRLQEELLKINEEYFMDKVIVSNKEEFESAVKNKASVILLKGELAKQLRNKLEKNIKRKKAGKLAILGGILLAAGAGAATIFTGGAAAPAATAAAAHFIAVTTSTTAVTVGTAEVFILCSTILIGLGIASSTAKDFSENYTNFKVTSEGVEFYRK